MSLQPDRESANSDMNIDPDTNIATPALAPVLALATTPTSPAESPLKSHAALHVTTSAFRRTSTTTTAVSTVSAFTTSGGTITTPRPDRVPSTPLTLQTSQTRPRSASLMALVQDPPTLPDISTSVSNAVGLTDFTGWRDAPVGSIVNPDEARFVDRNTTVEEATKILTNCGFPNVILVTDNIHARTAIGTFDYSDLNAYLLREVELVNAGRAHNSTRKPDRIRDLPEFGRREQLITLPANAPLRTAIEFLASGVHRIIVTEGGLQQSQTVVGVLTQLCLVRFFHDNRKNFPDLVDLYPRSLFHLGIGNRDVVSIHSHQPLIDGLNILHFEGITSIPVLDKDDNVIGNLSHVDTRLLTRESALPQFTAPCSAFITAIVSERGIEDGKDAFPVFYVSPYCTLAFTVAKLLATKSHRLWVVNSPTPSPSPGVSVPQTPVFHNRSSIPLGTLPSPMTATSSARRLSVSSNNGGTSGVGGGSFGSALPSPQFTHQHHHYQHHHLHHAGTGASATTPINTSHYPTTSTRSLSGRLDGVVSLTDIINLFARASGISSSRPDGARRLWHRRRSSSSSSANSSNSSNIPISAGGSIPILDSGVSRVAGRDRSVSSQSRTSIINYGNTPALQPPPPRR